MSDSALGTKYLTHEALESSKHKFQHTLPHYQPTPQTLVMPCRDTPSHPEPNLGPLLHINSTKMEKAQLSLQSC